MQCDMTVKPPVKSCTSSKERIGELVRCYMYQFQHGCGQSDCQCHYCPSSSTFEFAEVKDPSVLLKHALDLAKRAFTKDPAQRQYFFCPRYRIPVDLFHRCAATLDAVSDAKGSDDRLAALVASAFDGYESFLIMFPVEGESDIPAQFGSVLDAFTSLSAVEPFAVATAVFLDRMLADTTKPNAYFDEKVAVGGSPCGVLSRSMLCTRALYAILLTQSFSHVVKALAILAITPPLRQPFLAITSHATPELLSKSVMVLQDHMAVLLYGGSDVKTPVDPMTAVAEVMGMLFEANYVDNVRGKVSHTLFYNGTVTDFGIDDIQEDYQRYMKSKAAANALPQNKVFSFAAYPFLVDPFFKSILMRIASVVEQRGQMRDSLVAMLSAGNAPGLESMYLLLNIDRNNLLDSSLKELYRKSSQLRRPMRVKFIGEDGIDEGGVKKEWFQLITKQLLDPNFGMFEEKESRYLWFQPSIRCNMNNQEFYLIGQLVGLAVYNGVVFDDAFPKVVYRKLLGFKPDFRDLEALDPPLASGLSDLLAFEEADGMTVEDVFCREFVFEYDVFGSSVEVELVPGGKEKTLTKDNRQAFVDAVVQHVLVDSIEQNFSQFKRGFLSVAQSDTLNTMRPEELELLVCGNPELNFSDLEESTRYDHYTHESEPVKLFWSIVHEMSQDEQRQLLKFCTGSDRVPIKGLKDLQFIIGKNGDDSDLLPTAHTCFNHLLLPAYTSKDKMKEKLLKAIQNCTGFGMI